MASGEITEDGGNKAGRVGFVHGSSRIGSSNS